jgi:hypothetical protein
MSGAESQVDRLLEQSKGARQDLGHDRREPIGGRDPGRPATHCRVSHGRNSHSRATGDSTRSRRTSRFERGATRSRTDRRRTGARHPSPRGGRKTASGAWRTRRKRRSRQQRIEPLDIHLVFGRGRSEARARPRGRSRRRTAGGEQAAAMRYGCRRGENLRRVARQRGRRTRPEELRLRRPIRPKPGEPRPGTGCNTPEAVNGGNRRGGEKPRGRSVTDGVATIGRRRISVLREWTFTRPSGDGRSTKDEVPGEEGSCTTRSASRLASQRIQLGSARTPKVRPRWEAA